MPTSSALRAPPLLSQVPRSHKLPTLLKALGRGTADGGPENTVREAAGLLAAIAHRQDRAAFAGLFLSYGPRLKGYLIARGADGATAEEIVQDVMLTVWRKADQFDPARGSASTWIFTLARNAFIDRVRRENRPEVDPTDPLVETSAPAVDSQVLDAETERELAAAVDALPAEQRHVVNRSYFHGQSLSQISAAEGLPLGTVKTRARLALSHLRALVTPRRET